MKTMSFRMNSQNVRQAIGIQVTFNMKQKLEKEHFLAKKYCLLGDFCVRFELLLGWNVHTYATTTEMKTMAFRIIVGTLNKQLAER